MSFLLFINFWFLISPWPYLHLYIYIVVRINKQRDMYKSFEFSSILSTVEEGAEQGGKSPFSLLSEPISPPSLLFLANFSLLPKRLRCFFSLLPTFPPYFSLLPTFSGPFLPPPYSVPPPSVDLSKHLIKTWIIRKFIQLVNFVTVYSFSFSAVDRVWLNLFERALSGNEQLPFIKTFVREFIQCRTFLRVLYWVRNARSAVYTWVRILYPVRNA